MKRQRLFTLKGQKEDHHKRMVFASRHLQCCNMGEKEMKSIIQCKSLDFVFLDQFHNCFFLFPATDSNSALHNEENEENFPRKSIQEKLTKEC
jgi:hypothetical protein